MSGKKDTSEKLAQIEDAFYALESKFIALFNKHYNYGQPLERKIHEESDEGMFNKALKSLSTSINQFSEYLENCNSELLNKNNTPLSVPDLTALLENLVTSHEKLAMKANKFSPHLRDRVRYYLNSIIEPLEKLCKAVIAFINTISHKAFKSTKLISSSFDSFKQASTKNSEASKDLPAKNRNNFDNI